jgi:O-antigen ligase
VIYFIYPYINGRIVAWVTVLVILILSSLAVLPGVDRYFSRLIDQRVEQSVGKSFSEMSSGRVTAYDYAYKRWQEQPLLGVGSCYIFPKADLINKRTSSARVHNYYLEVLAGQGGVGFFLLVVVLAVCLVMILKILFSKADAVMDGRMLVALFMYGTINWMFKESWGITYSIIALLSVYSKSGESGLPSPDEELFGTETELTVSHGAN